MEYMLFGLLWVLIVVAGLGGFVLWIVAIVELVKYDDFTWWASGKDKTTWLLVVILVGWLGAIIYWFSARSTLKEAHQWVTAHGRDYLAQYGYGAPGTFGPGGYQAPPPGGYQAPPPGGYQAPPPGGYQAPPPGGYQAPPPGGYQAPPPAPGPSVPPDRSETTEDGS